MIAHYIHQAALRWIGGAGIVIALCGLIVWNTHASVGFYTTQLQHPDTDEQVLVDNVPYQIESGQVYRDATPVTGNSALRPLRLAYAVLLARRMPLFGLAGTDPQELQVAVDSLQKAQDALANSQHSTANKNAVQSLYPIQFLDTLAKAEDARQTLLKQPTEAHETHYEQTLRQTLAAKKTALADFSSAWEGQIGTSSIRFPDFGGTLSTQTMRATLFNILNDLKDERATLDRRLACTNGLVSECENVPSLPHLSPPALSAGANRPLVSEIQRIWGGAYGSQTNISAGPTRRDIVLQQSACLGSLQGPYTTTIFSRTTDGVQSPGLAYLEDIFFIPTDTPHAPVLGYERGTLGISYTPLNPFKYYTCPEVGEDIGEALAVRAVTVFALSHPEIATKARAKLLKNPILVSQTDAALYVQEALETSRVKPQGPTGKMLQELSLMLQKKTAGLQYLLDDITHVSTTDAELAQRGINFDISARTLFLTHSAFPSFFRIGAASDVLTNLRILDNADTSTLLASLKTYSTLRLYVPEEKIVHDLRAFLQFENRLTPKAPTPSPTSETTK